MRALLALGAQATAAKIAGWKPALLGREPAGGLRLSQGRARARARAISRIEGLRLSCQAESDLGRSRSTVTRIQGQAWHG